MLPYLAVEPADSVCGAAKALRLIAVMQSFNAEGKRCFLNFTAGLQTLERFSSRAETYFVLNWLYEAEWNSNPQHS